MRPARTMFPLAALLLAGPMAIGLSRASSAPQPAAAPALYVHVIVNAVQPDAQQCVSTGLPIDE